MYVNDLIRVNRETKEQNRQLTMVVFAVALVFLAVATGMISGNVKRRIRADTRMIGALRAVGADGRTLTRAYTMQVGLNIGAGLLTGLVVILCTAAALLTRSDWWAFLGGGLGASIVFLAVALAGCLFIVRRNIREVTRRSVIENIREL